MQYLFIIIIVITFLEELATGYFVSAVELHTLMFNHYRRKINHAEICVGSTINQHRDVTNHLFKVICERDELRTKVAELENRSPKRTRE